MLYYLGTGYCPHLSFSGTEETGEEEPACLGGLSNVHTESRTAGDAAPFPTPRVPGGQGPWLWVPGPEDGRLNGLPVQPPLWSPVS